MSAFYTITRDKVNLDITHRCPLECLRCQRYTSFTSKGLKVTGSDMLFEDFKKVVQHFNHINFCGQVSDPVHHPKFVEFLQHIHDMGKSSAVHHATGRKKDEWYVKAWEAMPEARWWFGIDGLPSESHNYRKNQDGERVYEILKEARKHLKQKPIWQYIVFNYNEDHIDEAAAMAHEIDVEFLLIHSSRWLGNDDPLRPSDKYALRLS